MNIYVAIQNTVAQIAGMSIQTINKENHFWKIVVVKGDVSLNLELDEETRTVCVIEKKNVGYKSISRFMELFLDEVEKTEEDEDPMAPPRD